MAATVISTAMDGDTASIDAEQSDPLSVGLLRRVAALPPTTRAAIAASSPAASGNTGAINIIDAEYLSIFVNSSLSAVTVTASACDLQGGQVYPVQLASIVCSSNSQNAKTAIAVTGIPAIEIAWGNAFTGYIEYDLQ